MEMTFEQAEASLSQERKADLARLMWEKSTLPDDLTEPEKVFCFGLYALEEYEERSAIRRYFEP